jgi:hypothetical protein
LQEEWVENADRWVAGFLEKFEEGCHSMVTSFITICASIVVYICIEILLSPVWILHERDDPKILHNRNIL